MLPSMEPVGIMKASKINVRTTVATTSAHKMLSPHSRPVDFLMLVQSRLPTYLNPERLKTGRNTQGNAPCFH